MVDLEIFAQVENIVRQRIKKTRAEIEASLGHIANGNPLAAEQTLSRRLDRLQVKASLSRTEAEMISAAIDMRSAGERKAAAKQPGPEAILGPTLDFIGVAFLERGRRAADAVGRVAFLNGNPQGSGFLVGPRLFLTNNHVISSPADSRRFQVQFDYEQDGANAVRTPTTFLFDPESCFVSDSIEGLDYTLIGVGERRSGPKELGEFGFISLSDARDKHMLGEIANIVQHPDGRFKELVLRENRLVARDETVQVLHYVADTEQGSSGSPVFNNEWEPIALHHWAGPFHEVTGIGGYALAREINEGIRISAIVDHLGARKSKLPGSSASAVSQAMAIWAGMPRMMDETVRLNADIREDVPDKPVQRPEPDRNPPATRHNADGSVTWTFPVEINVRAPLIDGGDARRNDGKGPASEPGKVAIAEAAGWKTEDFDDRGGYEPGFIPGFVLAMPTVANSPYRLAKNLLAKPGEDPHELRYHHFSILMNADRRLAFVTACNIDGSRTKAVNREDKTVIDNPSLLELEVESISGSEASDAFRPDRRIDLGEQMNQEFYSSQNVPGFPVAKSKERIARMFQKGHITLRGDPAWGVDQEAVAAERDTFVYTNAAPQVGFFNQGSSLNHPGSKGKLRWRAVETYVLRNAYTTRGRVTVFAGPVFGEDDPPYRFDSHVPLKFWKIALWSDQAGLRAIALLADQKPVLEVMPEAFGERAEAFDDPLEIARVSEFLSTVAEIEELTGLNFGQQVRDADIRAGSESAPAQSFNPTQLAPKTSRPKASTSKTSTSKTSTSKTSASKTSAASARRPAKRSKPSASDD
ncbi:DNA/RNA non-specific endonuclease [Mesorhizobium sp. M0437]|uniref:DNA/RNA non-specific endonuclease n=1 Tax=Mesorhizobium sp. M0437 TaxID=2956945 RepID=UPI0033380B7F